MTQSLGLKAYPETFVIAPDRRILRRISGQREWDSPEMISMLEQIQKL